jgi:hypothetical protein
MAVEPRRDDLLDEVSTPDDRENQLLDLVRLDYDATLRALSGFVTSGVQTRAIGLAAWGVILGLAMSDLSGWLALLSLAVVVLFAYADYYHAALYRQSLSRAIKIETILDAYVQRLGIAVDDVEAILRVVAKLENHKFGLHRNLKPVRLAGFFDRRSLAPFGAIYAAAGAVSLGLSVGFFLT